MRWWPWPKTRRPRMGKAPRSSPPVLRGGNLVGRIRPGRGVRLGRDDDGVAGA